MKLSIFSNIGKFFTNMNLNLNGIITILFIILVILLVIKSVIYKKVYILSIIYLGILLISTIFLFELATFVKVIYLIVYLLTLVYSVLYLIFKTKIELITKNKVKEYLKNSEYEYFITINNRNRVIDASNNVLELTNHTYFNQHKLKFPNFLFDYMNIIEFDNQKVTVEEIKYISNQIKEASSKFKTYSFNFVCLTDKNSKVIYDAVIEPIYLGSKLVSKNIYFSVDKEDLVRDAKLGLIKCANQIEAQRKQLFVIMSLTSGVLMYYDFTSKTYIPTQSFMNYTNSNQTEYAFNEYLKMIHPEDVEFFIDQSETINTLNSTRIKYRLLVNDKYFNVFEDSIYLENQDKLVSLIRICNTLDEGTEKKTVLSTDEAKGLIDSLNESNISDTLNETMELLKGLNNEK